jgi:hydrogenase/urease accessory protein HupE
VTETTADFRIIRWRGIDAGPQGLDGRTLTIQGLERTITDVMVSVSLLEGDGIKAVLRPHSTALTFDLHRKGIAVPAYLELGIEHILTGIDHLAFVLGLMLLVRSRRTLIGTISAFTVAHSLSLSASALHVMFMRPAVTETLVAFSILIVAVEVVHAYRGRTSLAVRRPWLIAFTFGLLHGAAFAGALAEIGLPPHAVAVSLLLFNIGVEIGQLIFVGAVLMLSYALARVFSRLPGWARLIPAYAIGSSAACWFFQRLVIALH